jgi:hypothetical protein
MNYFGNSYTRLAICTEFSADGRMKKQIPHLRKIKGKFSHKNA